MPVAALKYFPKKDGLGKCSMSLICYTLNFSFLSKALASRMTKSRIQSEVNFPLALWISWERYLGVMQSLSA